MLALDADACISDGGDYHPVLDKATDVNPTLFREFERIAEQIKDDLFEPASIANHLPYLW